MSTSERSIRLFLRRAPIATLVKWEAPHDRVKFELHFDDSFISSLKRPVLSLKCNDWRFDVARRFTGRMPPFLTNILPEGQGALRRRIAQAAAIDPADEFELLEVVGQDLPGALTAESTEVSDSSRRTVIEDGEAYPNDPLRSRLRFSLAGMQLKFSVERTDRISLPLSGKGGRWILKVPDGRHQDLARVEYAAMLWAVDTGFEVPAIEVIDPRRVEGLPQDTFQGIDEALLVRRFDRLDDRRPVHMEELTSVLGLHPEEKYPDPPSTHRYNLVAVARIVRRFAGNTALRTFFARIVFDVLAGNGDGHLKNWAFIYPDGRQAVLAPAYDIVPTILYGYPPQLAIAFTSERHFRAFDENRIRQFAKKLDEEPDEFVDLARKTVKRALDSFHGTMARAGLSEESTRALEAYWSELPLTRMS